MRCAVGEQLRRVGSSAQDNAVRMELLAVFRSEVGPGVLVVERQYLRSTFDTGQCMLQCSCGWLLLISPAPPRHHSRKRPLGEASVVLRLASCVGGNGSDDSSTNEAA